MKKALITAAVVAAAATLSTGAHAYTAFFGEDLNNSADTPLAAIPNSSGAESLFLANLTGAGTETFEGQATGATAPLVLSFPGFGGGTLNATMSGTGIVSAVAPGTSNGAGRYSIPSASSSKFWEVDAGSGVFEIVFGQDIAAFGFYGVDIGDFGGQVQLELYDAASILLDTLTVNNTIGSGGSTDGSVLYFGALADSAAEQFRSIRFITTTGQGDIFAFDNFTIAEQRQVIPQPNPVPEPGSLALVAAALLGLGAARRRRA